MIFSSSTWLRPCWVISITKTIIIRYEHLVVVYSSQPTQLFDSQMPSGIQGPFKGMVSFGQLVGQLTFGFLGDGMYIYDAIVKDIHPSS